MWLHTPAVMDLISPLKLPVYRSVDEHCFVRWLESCGCLLAIFTGCCVLSVCFVLFVRSLCLSVCLSGWFCLSVHCVVCLSVCQW